MSTNATTGTTRLPDSDAIFKYCSKSQYLAYQAERGKARADRVVVTAWEHGPIEVLWSQTWGTEQKQVRRVLISRRGKVEQLEIMTRAQLRELAGFTS